LSESPLHDLKVKYKWPVLGACIFSASRAYWKLFNGWKKPVPKKMFSFFRS